MGKIIFVPICERCQHEFEELELHMESRFCCPICGAVIEEVEVPSPNITVSQGSWTIDYSKAKYYGEE